MIEDRLSQLLLANINDHSSRALLLFMITPTDLDTIISSVRAELGDQDELLEMDDTEQFALYMEEGTEAAAMRLARLARGAFQRHPPTSLSTSLSCGIVIFDRQSVDASKLLTAAHDMVMKAQESTGNNIELCRVVQR